MADSPHASGFMTNGEWTIAGSQNFGQFEKAQGYTPSPQQSTESAISYETRILASNEK